MIININRSINNSGLFTLNNKSNIKIGVVTPLTGDMSMYGLSSKAAIEFAADSIDYKINGQNIEFIFEDGQCNSESGTKSFNKLVNVDKVDFIIGSICSSETLAGKDIINENKILTISSCASAPNLRNASKYLFSLYPLDDLDGKYSAEYIINKLNIKKVAILVCNSDWCKGEADIFKKHILN
jgi:branched-chain amino acid transport system substrate-binding protein